jgi:hypothetical protein
MLYSDFYNDFLKSYDDKDLEGSVTSLMGELGNIIVTDRGDFEDLLIESGVQGDLKTMSDAQLVNLYIDNISSNKELQLGTSMLINHHNKQSSMDGDKQMDDACVKAGFHTLTIYFSEPSENYSQAIGVGPIAQAVSESAKLGSKIAEGKQKKKYGAIDLATKKQEAKDKITQQVLAQKQTQLEIQKAKQESRSKTTTTIVMVAGGLIAVGVIAYLILKLKKK